MLYITCPAALRQKLTVRQYQPKNTKLGIAVNPSRDSSTLPTPYISIGMLSRREGSPCHLGFLLHVGRNSLESNQHRGTAPHLLICLLYSFPTGIKTQITSSIYGNF
jgi:hypothetical protein